MFKTNLGALLLAGMSGLAGSFKAPASAGPLQQEPAYVRRAYARGRYAGPRGQAGDKLARMAAEGRIGMRHGS
jgi:hypothetical protein